MRWGPGWGSGGQPQMDEDLGHHGGLFDGGNERQGAAALRSGGHVNFEHPFEQLGPPHAGMRPSVTLNQILDRLLGPKM